MSAADDNRLARTFAGLKQQGRKALVIYLMAGDPDPGFTARLVPKLAEAGADVVELGFPFSDPVADGPVIQEAGTRALRQFTGLGDLFALVRRIREASAVPLCLMTYYNLIFRYGEEAFARDAATAGLDGAIIPDLPIDEAGDWPARLRETGLAPVLLEAPNTDEAHMRRIAGGAGGFIYLVSLKGVTGSGQGLGSDLADRVARLRAVTGLPLCVGFGISTPEQARDVSRLADGVVVGSGVVRRIAEAGSADAAERSVLDYVRALRSAMDA